MMDTKAKATIFALFVGAVTVWSIGLMFEPSDGEKLNIMLKNGSISYDTVIGTKGFQSCTTDACLEKEIRKEIRKQYVATTVRG